MNIQAATFYQVTAENLYLSARITRARRDNGWEVRAIQFATRAYYTACNARWALGITDDCQEYA